MELTNVEMQAVKEIVEQSKQIDDARELHALELALIGGGIGDVQF